jgi:hypothetical protein
MLPEDPDDDLEDDDEDDIDEDGGGEDDEDDDEDEDEDEEEEETWQVSDSPFLRVGLPLTSGFDLLDSVRFTSSSKLG